MRGPAPGGGTAGDRPGSRYEACPQVTALIVLGVILVALVVAFALFYRHSRTPEWGDSEFRKSMLGMMVAIAPLWGMRYKEPHHELPTLSTPAAAPGPLPVGEGGGGAEEPAPGTETPATS